MAGPDNRTNVEATIEASLARIEDVGRNRLLPSFFGYRARDSYSPVLYDFAAKLAQELPPNDIAAANFKREMQFEGNRGRAKVLIGQHNPPANTSGGIKGLVDRYLEMHKYDPEGIEKLGRLFKSAVNDKEHTLGTEPCMQGINWGFLNATADHSEDKKILKTGTVEYAVPKQYPGFTSKKHEVLEVDGKEVHVYYNGGKVVAVGRDIVDGKPSVYTKLSEPAREPHNLEELQEVLLHGSPQYIREQEDARRRQAELAQAIETRNEMGEITGGRNKRINDYANFVGMSGDAITADLNDAADKGDRAVQEKHGKNFEHYMAQAKNFHDAFTAKINEANKLRDHNHQIDPEKAWENQKFLHSDLLKPFQELDADKSRDTEKTLKEMGEKAEALASMDPEKFLRIIQDDEKKVADKTLGKGESDRTKFGFTPTERMSKQQEEELRKVILNTDSRDENTKKEAREKLDKILRTTDLADRLTSDGRHPFREAMYGHEYAVKKLLEGHPERAMAQDKYGFTLLTVACFSREGDKKIEIVKQLLAANPNCADVPVWYATSLHLAAERGNEKIVAALLEGHPERANAPGRNGKTPLDYAKSELEQLKTGDPNRAKYENIVKQLEAAKALADAKSKSAAPSLEEKKGEMFRLALHGNVEGNLEKLKTLLKANPALATETNERGETILHIAAAHNHEKMVDYLANKHPEAAKLVWARNQYVETPLELAEKAKRQLNAGNQLTPEAREELEKRYKQAIKEREELEKKALEGDNSTAKVTELMNSPEWKDKSKHIEELDKQLTIDDKLRSIDRTIETLKNAQALHTEPPAKSADQLRAEKEQFDIVKLAITDNVLNLEKPKDGSKPKEVIDFVVANPNLLKMKVDGHGLLHHAAASSSGPKLDGESKEFFAALLKHADKDDLRLKDKDGLMPHHVAALDGNVDRLKAFLEKDPELLLETDAKGRNVLRLAVESRDMKKVDFLLNEFLDPKNSPIKDKLLHDPKFAAIKDRLLAMKDHTGKTALDFARDRAIAEKDKTPLTEHYTTDKHGIVTVDHREYVVDSNQEMVKYLEAGGRQPSAVAANVAKPADITGRDLSGQQERQIEAVMEHMREAAKRHPEEFVDKVKNATRLLDGDGVYEIEKAGESRAKGLVKVAALNAVKDHLKKHPERIRDFEVFLDKNFNSHPPAANTQQATAQRNQSPSSDDLDKFRAARDKDTDFVGKMTGANSPLGQDDAKKLAKAIKESIQKMEDDHPNLKSSTKDLLAKNLAYETAKKYLKDNPSVSAAQFYDNYVASRPDPKPGMERAMKQAAVERNPSITGGTPVDYVPAPGRGAGGTLQR